MLVACSCDARNKGDSNPSYKDFGNRTTKSGMGNKLQKGEDPAIKSKTLLSSQISVPYMHPRLNIRTTGTSAYSSHVNHPMSWQSAILSMACEYC